ncbi:amidohydrolase family protein [Propionicimonas sp.]|uniref:amidohydrolase family protein n=1 Tax=Propionicimonas sp. TaxID=1955623 RepID=UPI0017C176FC|nr:amidohydrolase family protein [Propionicimonas sp.]MBU3976212.1 amidohydrolase family protein [Actinomycetota bacterium]MBA3021024.1 amidohydrolase family protein [Propionicimonas sp.]MBU3985607.1 amidohydrolase family protein [Actinomycetota bacterium]MBU4008392.1 amidohydrolase family protein [Actinomycetota bacterium]MBU4066458.1 amidohydrolase family protein [Actinomycetota bacterium]
MDQQHAPLGLGEPEFFVHSHGVAEPSGPLHKGALHLQGVILPDGEVGELWVVDGVLRTEPVADAVTVCRGAWIMPGLVDAHCHVGLGPHGPVPNEVAEAQAVTDREAGTLLIRDAGSPIDTRWIDDRPDLPRIVRAGRHIARTKRYLRNYANEVEPEELIDEVARQAVVGDGWVKLVGDWIDRDSGDLGPLWPAEVATAAIAKAHELGARVTAHCFGEESVQQLVRAGIDGIEHGTGLDPATIELMADRGVALVPTMINLENFPAFADAGEEKFPRYAAHMRDLYERRYQTLGAAVEAGVPVFAGTDAGGTIPHGLIAAEVELLAKLGGVDFALGAASWRARNWLGAPELADGQWADLVVYAADPRRELAVLAHPELVILRGRVVAGPVG